jgi:hypothetical protein
VTDKTVLCLQLVSKKQCGGLPMWCFGSLVDQSLAWWFNLGKVLGWLYQLGKWVRLFRPFAYKASGFGGVPDSFPSSLAFPLPR